MFDSADDGAPDPNSQFLADVVVGLGKPQKTLPCKYFYDEVGSQLFEKICETPEYYPTRTERAILQKNADVIVKAVGRRGVLLEPGAGSGEKTWLLIEAAEVAVYVPIDISADYLDGVAASIAAEFPGCRVRPSAADFTQPMHLPGDLGDSAGRTLFFPGSTIGNFTPESASDLMRQWRELIGPDGCMLFGVDLIKPTEVLEAAYDDAQGVTAAFNLNLLQRIRDELGGTLDLDGFRHRAIFNEMDSRVEMHLVSTQVQTIEVGGHVFRLNVGETIHTENSHKYSLEGFASLAADAGLRVTQVWTDEDGLFSVQLLRPVPSGTS